MKQVNYNVRYSYKGNNSFLYAMSAIFTILDYVPWCTKRTRHVGKSTGSIWAPETLSLPETL